MRSISIRVAIAAAALVACAVGQAQTASKWPVSHPNDRRFFCGAGDVDQAMPAGYAKRWMGAMDRLTKANAGNFGEAQVQLRRTAACVQLGVAADGMELVPVSTVEVDR